MNKQLAALLSTALIAAPALAFADTSRDTQIAALYSQLIHLLRQQISVLQGKVATPSNATVSWEPKTGAAPLTTVFSVENGSGTETLIFGDGTWNGTYSCTKNKLDFCDLSKPIAHTYKYPGSYTVQIFSHINDIPALVASTTIVVGPFATTTQQ